MAGDMCRGKRGRVTDLLREATVAGNQTDAYLCGSQAMVGEASQILLDKGVPRDRIHHENFY